VKPYRTLFKRAQDEFIVNKSRFIGHACPCETEEDALAFLSETRAAHKDASHNCYAYIIGANMGIMRYSDDGEPGGTAGLPIIEVMKARAVTNCALVVTRYFGGVLLGAGGLVRAYSKGAAAAIDAAGVGEMHPTARYLMDVKYPLLGRIERYLASAPAVVEDKTFADVVTLTLIVKNMDEDALVRELIDVAEGDLVPVRFEEFFHPWSTP
jgi:uncharacterized YigZ family protein